MVGLYFSKRVSRAAAELAYFLILTFFPILICLSAFLKQLNLDLAAMLEEANYLLPDSVIAIFQDYLNYLNGNQSVAMFLTGIFLAVLFASAAMRGLMNIMHEIYGRATFLGLRQIGASVLFSVLLLVTVYLSLAVVVTGNWFFHLLGQVLRLENLVERFGTWQWVKYVLLIAIVFLFILLLYRFTAPWDKPRPPVVPGAVGAAVALAVASMIFSDIMGNSARYSLVYGSLTSVIILLIWLYLCGNVVIMGNVVNYVIYRHRKQRRQREKDTAD
ncbi:MAG TPA: YihY/virulence factor BrkB family protein [Candidatus Enterenecus stercoripullorum]|nr:YihY/virulence factor BrkB family protein [Candidatus Enterenecus stercoripullorum]